MRAELLVGLNVIDQEGYQNYRDAMSPILSTYGGGFGYDFRISEVLRTENNEEINRVFTIYFPDNERMEAFFRDENYVEVKEMFYESSVSATNILATYSR